MRVNEHGTSVIWEYDVPEPSDGISVTDESTRPDNHGYALQINLAYEGCRLDREQVVDLVCALQDWLALRHVGLSREQLQAAADAEDSTP